MMNQGALVLDLSVKEVVIWRGVAQARVAFEADDKKREAILREGVRDLFKKYPPRISITYSLPWLSDNGGSARSSSCRDSARTARWRRVPG